jgi:uncharacterized lipoprotein YddW (UPF0748 family)/sugar lactone lactonase YvrE
MKRKSIISIFMFCIFLLSFNLFSLAADYPTEARFIWVSRWMYSSEKDVREIIQKASQTGFNGVFFQVRGNGTVYYKSKLEMVEERIGGDTATWDPLAVAIDEAHKNGMQLHAWVNTFPGWTGKKAPQSPKQLWNTHRDWFCVDKDGKLMELNGEYVVLSPGIPAVQDYLYNVFMEIVKNYDVDGLHLDYVRYFGSQYSYDSISLSRFKAQYGKTPEDAPAAWDNFRRQQVTDLVARLYKGIHETKPEVCLSAATWGDWDEGYNFYLQDAHGWLARGIIDFVCPMTYTHDPVVYQKNMESHMPNTHGRYIFPGVGIFTMKKAETMNRILSVSDQYPNPDGLKGNAYFDWTGIYKEDKEGNLNPTPMQKVLATERFKKVAQFPVFPWKYEKGNSTPILIDNLKNEPRIIHAREDFNIYADIQLNSNNLAVWKKQPAVFLVYSEEIFTPDYSWSDKQGLKVKTKSKIKGIIPMGPVPDSMMWVSRQPIQGEKAGSPYYCKVVAVDSKGNVFDSELDKVQFYYPAKPYLYKGAVGPSYLVSQFITMDNKSNIWFCDYKKNAIRIIDTKGNEKSFSGFTSIVDENNKVIPITAPSGLAKNPQGDIFVSWGTGTVGYIAKLDSNTGKGFKTWKLKYLPGDLDIDNHGNIFVIERVKSKWHAYSPEGMELEGSPYSINSSTDTQINRGIAVSSDGKKVYVISESQQNVMIFTGSIDSGRLNYNPDKDLTSVSGAAGAIDIDKQGNIYVSDLGNECIKVFTPDGKHFADLAGGNPPITKPRGVAITPDGRDVYIMEMGPGRILHWSKE